MSQVYPSSGLFLIRTLGDRAIYGVDLSIIMKDLKAHA